ncbi:segregation and condensation protein A [Rhizobium oryzicola]|uniref:Segregation and condensation protein A n=1 Tax=Rhizobium oryzicola TaxID=1232668 RepID=A0ABT8T3F3_9HYPH|nr:ScpA family protein [Rhizobium oryzicola]MDO1585100.1 ScpA family protein [Rhizobium oryzicola]
MATDTIQSTAIPMDRLWQDADQRGVTEPALVIDVGGFEGPLDLLLHLARTQKVDLARISVLSLAEQYLLFIESARRVRIELAADYLVMAAWLAYLKSKLLIPQQVRGDDGPTGEEMAATLAFRLKRLEAMREAATRLINRNRLGRDVFARGAPEHIAERHGANFDASLYDLLSAYANLRQRQAVTQVTIERRKVWSLVEARQMLTDMLGDIGDWTALQHYLLQYMPPAERVTATASAFAASLELVREGKLEMRQEGAFEPLYMRRPVASPAAEPKE